MAHGPSLPGATLMVRSVCWVCHCLLLHRLKQHSTESSGLEKTFSWTPPHPPNHFPNCHIHSFLEHFQEWTVEHFPGQPVPVLNYSFTEKVFPHENLSLPGAAWGNFPFFFITGCLGGEANPHFAPTSTSPDVQSHARDLRACINTHLMFFSILITCFIQ